MQEADSQGVVFGWTGAGGLVGIGKAGRLGGTIREGRKGGAVEAVPDGRKAKEAHDMAPWTKPQSVFVSSSTAR